MCIRVRIDYAHIMEAAMKVSDVQRGYAGESRSVRKARLNITVDADLLSEARKQGLNLSELMERAIADVTKAERSRKWREDNAEAIRQHNDMVEREGLWSDGLRPW
jgi:antitoxin CcdA